MEISSNRVPTFLLMVYEVLLKLHPRLDSAVTPWLNVPYPEQLRRKEEELKNTLKKIKSAITDRTTHPVSKQRSSLSSLSPLLNCHAKTLAFAVIGGVV